jgi:O-antigen ligase
MSEKQALLPNERSQHRTFWILTVLAGVFMGYGLLNGLWFFAALPVILILLAQFVFRLDILFFLCVLLTPLSLNLAHTSIGIGVSLPSEPLMFLLFLVYLLKKFQDGGFDPKIIRHPVTVLLLLQLTWQTITTLTSTMPLVSVKSTLARFCFTGLFYFMFLDLLTNRSRIEKFIWYYTIPLLLVIGYTIAGHASEGFSEEAAHTAMVPFYNDHTAYAAVICFFIPVMIGFTADTTKSRTTRLVAGSIAVVLLVAIVLSYTRAAWVGLVAALGCYLVFALRMKSALVYSGFALLILLAFLFRTQITLQLEGNDEVSSDDYASHVQSIGNINSDDSNIERLNRWACALRMFADKPVFGFGPGTYMFQYGAYQKYSERSGISTNFAEGGGSHSEYLGPMSEQGFMAPLLFIGLIIAVAQTTATFLKKSRNKSDIYLARGVLLGLVTYWVHGVLNYFLDTEKASVPFWGFIAILVALQIYSSPEEKNTVIADGSSAK